MAWNLLQLFYTLQYGLLWLPIYSDLKQLPCLPVHHFFPQPWHWDPWTKMLFWGLQLFIRIDQYRSVPTKHLKALPLCGPDIADTGPFDNCAGFAKPWEVSKHHSTLKALLFFFFFVSQMRYNSKNLQGSEPKECQCNMHMHAVLGNLVRPPKSNQLCEAKQEKTRCEVWTWNKMKLSKYRLGLRPT